MIKETQYRKLLKVFNSSGEISMSSLKSGMTRKTGSKYLKAGKGPSAMKKPHTWRTRQDPFIDVKEEINTMLDNADDLEALTIFEYLQEKYPGKFQDGQLRTLERRIRLWKIENQSSNLLSIPQVHQPGKLMELDWTCMNQLKITIDGQLFKHKLCHTVLTYSNWEWAEIAYSENFLSLKKAFQSTVFRLGAVPETLQMDNSSTATHNVKKGKKKRELNENYLSFLNHFKVKSRMININSPDENGDIESANGHLKRRIGQHLSLRGSRDFSDIEEYNQFLQQILLKTNSNRAEKVKEELSVMRELPELRLPEYIEEEKRVNSFGMIRVKNVSYSLPSRLKGVNVRVRIYDDIIKVLLESKELLSIPRRRGTGFNVDYRHVIGSLRRKPGAFANCQYKDQMFPLRIYYDTYEILQNKYNERQASKEYLEILYLASLYGEDKIAEILKEIITEESLLTMDNVKIKLEVPMRLPEINIQEPSLSSYDQFISKAGGLICLLTHLFSF